MDRDGLGSIVDGGPRQALRASDYHSRMATWILIGGIFALVLILTAAVLLVLWFTRDGTDDSIRIPRFRRFGVTGDDGPEAPLPEP